MHRVIDVERWARMTCCAIATGLPRCDQHARAAAAAADERAGQRRRDPRVCHQTTVLQRQRYGEKVQFTPSDRAWLAAVLHRLPRDTLRRLRLLVRSETMLRWHRDLIGRRHARLSRPGVAGGHEPSGRSDGCCCAWPASTPHESTAASTANSSSWVGKPPHLGTRKVGKTIRVLHRVLAISCIHIGCSRPRGCELSELGHRCTCTWARCSHSSHRPPRQAGE